MSAISKASIFSGAIFSSCAPSHHTSIRHHSCCGGCNHARRDRTPSSGNTGKPRHVSWCGSLPIRPASFWASIGHLPRPARPLQPVHRRFVCKACRALWGRACPVQCRKEQQLPPLSSSRRGPRFRGTFSRYLFKTPLQDQRPNVSLFVDSLVELLFKVSVKVHDFRMEWESAL